MLYCCKIIKRTLDKHKTVEIFNSCGLYYINLIFFDIDSLYLNSFLYLCNIMNFFLNAMLGIIKYLMWGQVKRLNFKFKDKNK